MNNITARDLGRLVLVRRLPQAWGDWDFMIGRVIAVTALGSVKLEGSQESAAQIVRETGDLRRLQPGEAIEVHHDDFVLIRMWPSA